MRISHDTLNSRKSDESDDDSYNTDNSGLPADRLHRTSAHIPLREHVSVPMPPRSERRTLMPPLVNVETVATELHVERQAPDADTAHEYDGSALLYDRHERDRHLKKEIIDDSDDQQEDNGTDDDDTSDETADDTDARVAQPSTQPPRNAPRHSPHATELFHPPLADVPSPEDQPAEKVADNQQPQTQSPETPALPAQPAQGEYAWPDFDHDATAPLPPIHSAGQTVHARQVPPATPQFAAVPNTANAAPGHNQPPIPPQPPLGPPQPGHGGGNLPPQPPTGPPVPPNYNQYGTPGPNPNIPYNPNFIPPQPYAPYNPNQTVAPPYANAPVGPPQPHRGIDALARLGVIGNFIGNHRTRKRLGKQIAQNQRQTNANFADLTGRNLRFNQSQQRQDRDIRQLQHQQQNGEQRLNAVERYDQPPIPPQPPTMPGREAAAYPGLPPASQGSESLANMRPRTPSERAYSSAGPDVGPVEQQPGTPSYQQLEQVRANPAIIERPLEASATTNPYGQETQRERQHEIIADRAGGQGTGGYQQQTQQYTHGGWPTQSGLPSGMTTPTLPQGTPTHADPQHQLPERTRSGVPGLAFWIMLAIIVAAFFAAALI